MNRREFLWTGGTLFFCAGIFFPSFERSSKSFVGLRVDPADWDSVRKRLIDADSLLFTRRPENRILDEAIAAGQKVFVRRTDGVKISETIATPLYRQHGLVVDSGDPETAADGFLFGKVVVLFDAGRCRWEVFAPLDFPSTADNVRCRRLEIAAMLDRHSNNSRNGTKRNDGPIGG